jgi:hypothetical protein
MRRYKPLLDEFIRQLAMERTKYVSTCREIFVEDFPFDLLPKPASDIWNSEAVQAKLKSRLHPNYVDQFIDAAESLNSVLKKLRKKFPKDDPVCTYSAIRTAFELTLAQLRQHFFKKLLMRLNLTMLEASAERNSCRFETSTTSVHCLMHE